MNEQVIDLQFLNLSYSSVGVHVRNIRTVFNQAISKKIISPESYLFGKGKYVPPSSKKVKKALPVEVIGKIYDYNSDNPQEVKAIDMWLFAYFANGMNVKDIAFLKIFPPLRMRATAYSNVLYIFTDLVLSILKIIISHCSK